MSNWLDGKTCIVTGASGGMGARGMPVIIIGNCHLVKFLFYCADDAAVGGY